MKLFKFLLLALVVFYSWSIAIAANQNGSNGTLPEIIPLNGPWWFWLDPNHLAEKDGLASGTTTLDGWRSVRVPISIDEAATETRLYEGVSWFRRTFTIPAAWRDRRIVLRFEAVNTAADVYLNGEKIFRNEDAYLPFEIDIGGKSLRYRENVLVVRVDNTRHDDWLPNGIWTEAKARDGGGGVGLAWHPPGGIVREVTLCATDLLRIDSLRVNGKPAQPACRLDLNVRVRNDRTTSLTAQLNFQILDHHGHPFMQFSRGPFSIAAGETATIIGEETVSAMAWSPESPVLYTLVTELVTEGQPVHSQRVRFGFRSIEAREGLLLLNGQPIFLTGFNRHDDSPTRWNCPDPATAKADLEHIRHLGGNFVRLCHYPNHPLILDLCDEIGLLVMEELPLFWWRGTADGQDVYQTLLTRAQGHLTKLIDRDYNHPSVIMWSVGNEWQTQRPGVREGTEVLIRLAQKLDSTRLALHVSDHWRKEYDTKDWFDADDAIALTGYPNPPTPQWWVEGIERLRAKYPGKPVFLTELGHYNNAEQAAAYEAAIEAVRRSHVCGLVIWSWADYIGSREMGSSPTTFGVMTRDRQPKPGSLESVRRIFAEAQRCFSQMQSSPPAGGPAGESHDPLTTGASRLPSPRRNLIPDQPGAAPNYFCTWAAQNFAQEKETSARDHLTEQLVFDKPGWISNYYQAIRGDLFVVFDDGWDIPLSADGSQERWVFGSLELNEKRFPSITGNPAERLRKLNDKVRAAGWRGAGLWVSAQAVGDGHNGKFMNDADLEKYWRQRARWSRQAGIRYWKVDWGARDDRKSFRRLLTRIAREEAPELTVEHAAIIMPLNYWNGDGRFGSWARESGLARSFASFSDVFRAYDVCAQICTVTLLDRTGWILKNIPAEPGCQGLLNCEDEMYMGAALGCTVGVMRHPLWRMSDPRNNDFPKYGRRIDEVTRAVRWMRLAPPFGRGGEPVYLSEQTLADEWDFTEGQTWYRDVIGKKVIQRASAITARGIVPPEVVDAGDGVPFVVASRNPNGAVAVAALQRTLPGGVIRTPRAGVKLKVGSGKHPIGIFGPYHTLTLEFDESIAQRRILAQDLAGDRAVEITNDVKREDRTLTLSGELIDRVGLSAKTQDDLSEPGLVLSIE